MTPWLLSASVEKLGGATAETEQKPWCRHQSWKQFGTVVPAEQLWSTLWYYKAPSTSLSLGHADEEGLSDRNFNSCVKEQAGSRICS